MKKILIADDERLARVVLKSMLTEINPDFIFYEASNGIELTEKAYQFRPNLVFVDIQMPLCSGLESIEKISKELPLIEWIIVTGFAKFDYAKRAITLQVSEFLLKPVRKKELENAVKNALSIQEENQKKTFATFDQNVRCILNISPNQYYSNNYFQICIIKLSPKLKGIINLLIPMLKQIIHKEFDINGEGTVIAKENISIICSCNEKLLLENLFFNVLNKIVLKKLKIGWFFCSNSFQESTNLLENYQKLENASKYWGGMKPMHINWKVPEDEKILKLSNLLEQIEISFSEGKILQCQEYIENVKMIIKNYDQTKDIYVLQNLIVNLYSSIKLDIPEQNYSFEDINNRIVTIANNNLHSHSSQISLILQYIDEHFNEDIGVKTIAPLVNLSPNYFSVKFRQETGMKFLEYLTNKRIEQAKLLLEVTDMFVYEIAESVGFKDVKHFSHIFKQIIGIMPSKYRKKLNNRFPPLN